MYLLKVQIIFRKKNLQFLKTKLHVFVAHTNMSYLQATIMRERQL